MLFSKEPRQSSRFQTMMFMGFACMAMPSFGQNFLPSRTFKLAACNFMSYTFMM